MLQTGELNENKSEVSNIEKNNFISDVALAQKSSLFGVGSLPLLKAGQQLTRANSYSLQPKRKQ